MAPVTTDHNTIRKSAEKKHDKPTASEAHPWGATSASSASWFRIGPNPMIRISRGSPGRGAHQDRQNRNRRLLLVKKNPPGRNRADNAGPASDRNDRHDAERVRVDDQDLVPDDDEPVAAILRHDLHKLGRQRYQLDVPRNHGSDREREVHILHTRTRLLHDDIVDLGLLTLRELNRPAGGRTLLGLR